jgi:hypothetical protein
MIRRLRSLPNFGLSPQKIRRPLAKPPGTGIALLITLLGIGIGPMSISIGISIGISIAPASAQAQTLAVTQAIGEGPEEVPEEVLRQEMILEGRSPLDGAPLTATEYAELQAELERLNEPTPTVSPKLQQLVMLVKLRKFLKTVLPILPMK